MKPLAELDPRPVRYAALESLSRAGKRLVAVTGRPAGWCDHEAPVRARHRRRLEAIAARILRAVPGTALASDQPYRETDLAIDYCEDVPPLPLQAAANRQVLYLGDSPNDAPMFAFFSNSVGVANVRRFPGLRPSYVTRAQAGAGFAELAAHLAGAA